jgi:hypothetical protein
VSAAPEDVAAMRADGDLLDFVRSLAPSVTAKAPPADEAPPDIEISIPRPGAWPVGTQPPGPPESPAPPGAWGHALDRYRAGEDTGRPCECPRCQITA